MGSYCMEFLHMDQLYGTVVCYHINHMHAIDVVAWKYYNGFEESIVQLLGYVTSYIVCK